MIAKNSFLYRSSVWMVKQLKVINARTDRPCTLCKIGLFQNEDYPGEYLKPNQQSILCVRCAFRLVSHPVFKRDHTLTYDQLMSSDFDTMLFFKRLKEIYRYDHVYKELIYLDRQNEGKILTDADFDKRSSRYEKEWLYTDTKYTKPDDPYVKAMLDNIEEEGELFHASNYS